MKPLQSLFSLVSRRARFSRLCRSRVTRAQLLFPRGFSSKRETARSLRTFQFRCNNVIYFVRRKTASLTQGRSTKEHSWRTKVVYVLTKTPTLKEKLEKNVFLFMIARATVMFHLPGIGSLKCSLNHLNKPFKVACTLPRYLNPSGVTLIYSTRGLTRGRYPRKNFPGNSFDVLKR